MTLYNFYLFATPWSLDSLHCNNLTTSKMDIDSEFSNAAEFFADQIMCQISKMRKKIYHIGKENLLTMQLDKSIIFRVVNIIVGCFMIIGGVVTILTGGFPQFIRGIYCILFGVMVFLFEFRLPSVVSQYVSFMFSFFGRGVFYIFIGCILLNYLPLGIASGVIVAVAGVAFVILQFVSSIEPPSNMRREALDDSLQHGAGLGTRASNWANEHQSTQSPYGQSAAEAGYASGGNI